MANKCRPEDAARLIGANAQFVRIGLQQGKFPWGYAVKNKRWAYYINEEKLKKIEMIETE